MEKIVDYVKETLECPICYELLSIPILLCERGHSVCHRCRQHISRCPICKGNLTNIHNIFAQKISSRIPKTCEYKHYGCETMLMDSEKEKHKDNCKFRPSRCDLPDAKTFGTQTCKGELILQQDIVAHMRETHNMMGAISDSIHIEYYLSVDEFKNKNLLQTQSKAKFLNCYGGIFLAISTVSQKTRSFQLNTCASFNMVPNCTGNSFRTNISIGNEHTPHCLHLLWTGPVDESRFEIQRIIATGLGVSVPLDKILPLCRFYPRMQKYGFRITFSVMKA